MVPCLEGQPYCVRSLRRLILGMTLEVVPFLLVRSGVRVMTVEYKRLPPFALITSPKPRSILT